MRSGARAAHGSLLANERTSATRRIHLTRASTRLRPIGVKFRGKKRRFVGAGAAGKRGEDACVAHGGFWVNKDGGDASVAHGGLWVNRTGATQASPLHSTPLPPLRIRSRFRCGIIEYLSLKAGVGQGVVGTLASPWEEGCAFTTTGRGRRCLHHPSDAAASPLHSTPLPPLRNNLVLPRFCRPFFLT